ncbi:MAG: hypothetical protein COA43_00680 [Robiginitomaculum sp.]|nr:MAG: hypothetical protein COA43_00680 [Robiginitomaculum sp.]
MDLSLVFSLVFIAIGGLLMAWPPLVLNKEKGYIQLVTVTIILGVGFMIMGIFARFHQEDRQVLVVSFQTIYKQSMIYDIENSAPDKTIAPDVLNAAEAIVRDMAKHKDRPLILLKENVVAGYYADVTDLVYELALERVQSGKGADDGQK